MIDRFITFGFFKVLSLSIIAQNVLPPEPVFPLPSKAQLAWHEMELNAFVHFTTNTYTNLEWGKGNEDPSIFNPTKFNAQQWTTTLKQAGFKGLILTCKHHDGFCLWPSKYTEHSVKNSPYKNGKGDIVKEVRNACKKDGLKFGVYLSPWDRNHAQYGREEYLIYYRNQLKELFTNYGPVFEMWFDGANGGSGYYGGANETRKIKSATYYEWPVTISMVKKMEPDVIFFSDAGPGVRWVGNERGHVSETNWNTITIDTLYAGKPGIEKLLNTGSPDGLQWVPAEVDVSIRPGWFYHAAEDSLVKTPEQLFEIYMTSVGRGSTLLLNIPPDRRGLFHEKDVSSLKGFKKLLRERFGNNLAKGSFVIATNYRGRSKLFAPYNITDGNKDTYWSTDDNFTTGSFEINLLKKATVNYILLQEYIKLGQRIKAFTIEAWDDSGWQKIADKTTVGYKRIIKVNPVETNKIRINIMSSKACPLISNAEVY
jgi:alpha-L-fucosidase